MVGEIEQEERVERGGVMMEEEGRKGKRRARRNVADL
jgi:hypothetical protein